MRTVITLILLVATASAARPADSVVLVELRRATTTLPGSRVLLRDIAAALVPLLPDDAEVLAGLEMGGIPVATVLSQLTDSV